MKTLLLKLQELFNPTQVIKAFSLLVMGAFILMISIPFITSCTSIGPFKQSGEEYRHYLERYCIHRNKGTKGCENRINLNIKIDRTEQCMKYLEHEKFKKYFRDLNDCEKTLE